MKPAPHKDFGERYPEPIKHFDTWYAARLSEVATAKSEADIRNAVGMVAPYTDAKWCYPERLTKIESLARKRRNELARNTTNRMQGERHDADTGEVA